MPSSSRLACFLALIYTASLAMASWSPTEMLYSFLQPRAKGEDLQSFTGKLGAPAPAISDSGDSSRQFSVDGDTFSDFESASTRSCDVQFDGCQEKANTDGASFEVNDCDDQKEKCYSAQKNAPAKSFGSGSQGSQESQGSQKYERIPFDSEFDLLCEREL